LQAILYEVNEFFNDNRHYERLNITRIESFVDIIKNFDEMLKFIHEKILSASEKKVLFHYLSDMALGKSNVIEKMEAFYVAQNMNTYARLAGNKLAQIKNKFNYRFFDVKKHIPDAFKIGEEFKEMLLKQESSSKDLNHYCRMM
jgi:hypothetical protein